MKKTFQITLAALGLLAVPLARAWTYQDGDVLLIFRDGTYDVEFDLGNISQFTGKTNGYTAVVSNWSLPLVTSTFGPDLTTNGDGVEVLLVATTPSTDPNPTAWLSSSEPNTTAHSPSPSGWGVIYSAINGVGISPKIYNVPTNSVAQSYVIGTIGSGSAGKYKYASYDYIVSGGTYNGISQLGGEAPFIVEQNIPGTLDFWGIQATGSTPLPPDTLVGTFNITANGVLTFVAGPPPSNILGITRSGGTDTVSFTTRVGGNYWLAYTNTLAAPVSSWPLVSGPYPGDGHNDSLTHATSDSSGFYRAVRSP
jgi:hypothetical protein